jgi:hypothetical protein
MPVFRIIPAGDLELKKGNFVFLDGPDFVRQKLAVRFKFFAGEWFLDKRQGIPYFRDVYRKNPDLDLIRSLFRRVILTCPGIASCSRNDLVYDEPARTLAHSFQARLKGSGLVTVTPADRDFLVDVP